MKQHQRLGLILFLAGMGMKLDSDASIAALIIMCVGTAMLLWGD